jgi:hypothetical protein
MRKAKPLQLLKLRDLTALDLAKRRQDYPSVPEHALFGRKFGDKTANALTGAIEFYINTTGEGFVWRQGSEGRFRPGETVIDGLWGVKKQLKGKWLPGLTNGIGDLMGNFRGRPVAIEIKIGKDKQSDKQKEFQRKFEKSGGIYLIARSWEDFMLQLIKIFS